MEFSQSLRKRILKTIAPSTAEHTALKNEVDSFIDLLKKASKRLNIDVSFKIGGSFGKGTYLKNSFDVDIFSLFSKQYKDEELSTLLEQILNTAKISYQIQKGSRNYFSGTFGNKILFKFEVVPVFLIKEINSALNSTDHSPFHIDYVLSKSKENKELCNEIRLTKQLFKAQGLYGAESYILGFSGHVIDCLIMYYGSLQNLLEAMKDWREQTLLDIASHYSTQKEILSSIDTSKHSCLCVVDPVLPTRNAAKALSYEKYCKAIYFAKTTKTLTEDHFTIKKETQSQWLRKQLSHVKKISSSACYYEFSLQEIESEDIVGSKFQKLKSKMITYYKSFDFNINYSSFFIDFKTKTCVLFFGILEKTLPSYKIVLGPRIFLTPACLEFKKRHKNCFVINDRIAYLEKRKITTIEKVPKVSVKKIKDLHHKVIPHIKEYSYTLL
jgi:tRNA nucleotidyltransferase (CCA-adding enzyme)